MKVSSTIHDDILDCYDQWREKNNVFWRYVIKRVKHGDMNCSKSGEGPVCIQMPPSSDFRSCLYIILGVRKYKVESEIW